MAHYGGGGPGGYQPEEARTLVIPHGAVPDGHPEAGRAPGTEPRRGDSLREPTLPGAAPADMRPPRPARP
jgi:hypothetical protein